MSDKNTQPAFPCVMPHESGWTLYGCGLTKREYFAAKIIRGLAANNATWQDVTWEQIVKQAVNQADALISELEK